MKNSSANQEKIKTVTITPSDKELWKKCELLEYQVFLDAGYIKENSHRRLVDYDRFENSEIIAVVSDQEIVGTWRNIFAPNERKMRKGLFPTIDSAEELRINQMHYEWLMGLNPQTIVDLSAAAIRRDFRNGKISNLLFQKVIRRVFGSPPLRFGLGAPDAAVLKYYKKIGFYPLELGKPTLYWGSMTTPILIDTHRVLKSFPSAIFPFLFLRTQGHLRNLTGRSRSAAL